ncbi:MAG: transglycosylase domain-containing protein [Holosporales bacterium]|jgi:penicillin-binding protein 1A|nr:transglycosylase domain-containing protein [Holosporales bacterium]
MKKQRKKNDFFLLKQFFKRFFLLSFFTSLIPVIGVVLYFFWLNSSLPKIEDLNIPVRTPSVTIQAADGTVIATYGDLYEEFVSVKELPAYVTNAFLAVEDRRFYNHKGIDFKGIIRAFITNIRANRITQGGSTLTQQLAKNLLISKEIFSVSDRSIKRKMQELLLAFKLESAFSKDQILTLYLNRVFFGSGTFGIDAAARRYFQKSAKNLTVFEAALLAGVLRAPSRYSPVANPQQAIGRARIVLQVMEDAGYLDAKWKKLIDSWQEGFFASTHALEKGSRYFADWVFDNIPSIIGPIEQDIVVTTTLNTTMQKCAEETCKKFYEEFGKEYKYSQTAALVISGDGSVLAMVGGLDYGKSQFNRATSAMRQPGSSFKPFVYLAAFEAGIDSNMMMDDSPYKQGSWKPSNYKWRTLGKISLIEALTYSVNSVCIRVAKMIGMGSVIKTAKRLGINSPINYNLSSAIGASEATLLEMVSAYASFVNNGYAVWPYGIFEIRDKDGNILHQHFNEEAVKVIEEDALNQLKTILREVIRKGTGRASNVDEKIFGKTGSNGNYDAWTFVCRDPIVDSNLENVDEYSPKYIIEKNGIVVGVWIGNDSSKQMAPISVGGRIP